MTETWYEVGPEGCYVREINNVERVTEHSLILPTRSMRRQTNYTLCVPTKAEAEVIANERRSNRAAREERIQEHKRKTAEAKQLAMEQSAQDLETWEGW